MKPIWLFIFLTVVTACNPPKLYKSKSYSAWPEKGGLGYGGFVGNGTIYLKTNSTINGLVRIIPYYDVNDKLDSSDSQVLFLPAGKTKKEDIETIYLSDISNIKLQKGSSLDSAEFKPFGGILALATGKKNKIGLYCTYGYREYWLQDNNTSYSDYAEIILTLNDKAVDQFFTQTRSSQRYFDYRRFINKRYNLQLKKYYFKGKDEKVMINYILDKEDEKQNFRK